MAMRAGRCTFPRRPGAAREGAQRGHDRDCGDGPDGVPRQLPTRPRLFTGRTRELAELTASSTIDPEFNGTTPILVVSGMGGIGKTWLAFEWVYGNIDRFPDGQLYVNLRGYDPSGAPVTPEAAVRSVLDVLCQSQREIPVDTDAQAALYRHKVSDKRMLILNARGGAQHQPTELIVAHGARPLTLGILTDPEGRELLAKRLAVKRSISATRQPTSRFRVSPVTHLF
jgi:hypothetical protein